MRISWAVSVWTIETGTPASNPGVTNRCSLYRSVYTKCLTRNVARTAVERTITGTFGRMTLDVPRARQSRQQAPSPSPKTENRKPKTAPSPSPNPEHRTPNTEHRTPNNAPRYDPALPARARRKRLANVGCLAAGEAACATQQSGRTAGVERAAKRRWKCCRCRRGMCRIPRRMCLS